MLEGGDGGREGGRCEKGGGDRETEKGASVLRSGVTLIAENALIE